MEYKLQDSAVYITVKYSDTKSLMNPYSLKYKLNSINVDTNTNLYTTEQLDVAYNIWLWDLSSIVHDTLNKISISNSKRVIDMFKVATTVSHFTKKYSISNSIDGYHQSCVSNDKNKTLSNSNIYNECDLNTIDSFSHSSINSGVQSLLQYVMNNEVDEIKNSCTDDVVYYNNDDAIEKHMKNMYNNISMSFKNINEHTTNTLKFGRDVQLLLKDSFLISIINKILLACSVLFKKINAIEVNNVRIDYLSICITKILHGLPTKNLTTSIFCSSTHADCWGSYKLFNFDEIYSLVKCEVSKIYG